MTTRKTIVQREATTSPTAAEPPARSLLAGEASAIAGILTTIVFFAYGDTLIGNLPNHWLTFGLFLWLFGTMMWCSFGVVRQADAVAAKLGEPYGTMVLTFSVVIIEVALIASIMLHGDNNPTLARDAMFATLMIGLNGLVGVALLMGALRYWEQEYNLAGARAYLVIIAALSVFALILPNYTETAPDPSKSPTKAALFIAITFLFYLVFVAIQTGPRSPKSPRPIRSAFM